MPPQKKQVISTNGRYVTYHIHSHRISRHAAESEIHIPPSDCCIDGIQSTVVGGGVESLLQSQVGERCLASSVALTLNEQIQTNGVV